MFDIAIEYVHGLCKLSILFGTSFAVFNLYSSLKLYGMIFNMLGIGYTHTHSMRTFSHKSARQKIIE